MRHLNVEIEDEEYDVAKEGAARAGMKLRVWIGRLIMSTKPPAVKLRLSEPQTAEEAARKYVPLDEV